MMNHRNIKRMARLTLLLASPLSICLGSGTASAQTKADGEGLYAVRCGACHDSGLLGAPKLGQIDQWAARLAGGRAQLLEHAIKGFNNMPPRGGNPSLSDQQIGAIVDYMIARVTPTQGATSATAAPKEKPVPPPTAAPEVVKKSVSVASAPRGGVNSFNRLMKPPSKRNLPPAQDGIHDPDIEGTRTLQAPRTSFSTLPKSNFGNRVDWVQALAGNDIAPRYDRDDANAKPIVMDLNIVREVKGSMPNVIYPHKQHTEWLDCSNCHPAIFVPQKGANQMSMASILLGKQCGVCHGKVAFPVGDCRRCHSGKKAGGN